MDNIETGDNRIDEMMPQLFSSWLQLPFEECLDEIGDYVKLKQKDTNPNGKYPVVDQGEDLINGYVNDRDLLYTGELPVIIFGDHTRRIKFIDFPFAVGADGTKIFKPKKFFNEHFFSYYLNSLKIASEGYSRHYKFLKAVNVPLPPHPEQRRIVERLDAIMLRIASSRTRLEKIPALLKSFRQSALGAAVSGELTKRWRDENKIKREEWNEEAMSAIADVIDPNPKHRNPKYVDKGFIFLSTAQFAEPSGWNFKDVFYVTEDTVIEQERRCKLSSTSFVFSRKGTIGKVRFVPTGYRFALLDSVCVINTKDIVNPSYLYYAIQSPVIQSQIKLLSRGVALKQVSLTDVRSLQIPIPLLEEQKEIVRKIEELFHFADSIEARYQKAKDWFDKLPQSILAKAFRGELVPQNENDEPASELLKRIQQAKQTNHKPSSKTKRRKLFEDNDQLSLVAEE